MEETIYRERHKFIKRMIFKRSFCFLYLFGFGACLKMIRGRHSYLALCTRINSWWTWGTIWVTGDCTKVALWPYHYTISLEREFLKSDLRVYAYTVSFSQLETCSKFHSMNSDNVQHPAFHQYIVPATNVSVPLSLLAPPALLPACICDILLFSHIFSLSYSLSLPSLSLSL